MNGPRSYEFEGTSPTIDDEAHVSRESILVGDVTIAANASVWPGVVLRGDIGPVRVGEESHISDNVTVHASTIGDRVMIGHGTVVNEATLADDLLLGFNATVNTDVTIGEKSFVAAGAVVPEGYDIPPESFVRGIPAEATPLAQAKINVETLFEKYSPREYTELVERHTDLFERISADREE